MNPTLKYARVRQHGDIYYLSADCLDVLKEKGAYEVLGEILGEELVGRTYDGPFDELPVGAGSQEGSSRNSVDGSCGDRRGRESSTSRPDAVKKTFNLAKS